MSVNNTIDKQAREKIIRARTNLLVSNGFFGFLAMQLRLVEATEHGGHPIDTMAVDGRSIFYNPAFVHKLDEREVEGVLAHEVLHCCFQHFARRGNRDSMGWNIACLAENSQLTKHDGSFVQIKDVCAGELLRSPLGASRVLAVVDSGKKKLLELCLNNGIKLYCSNEHGVLTNEGFISAGKIKKGSKVILDSRYDQPVNGNGRKAFTSGNSRKSEGNLPTGRIGNQPVRAFGKTSFSRENGIQGSAVTLTTSSSLPSRHNRWRRDNILREGLDEGENLLSAFHQCVNDINLSSQLANLSPISWKNFNHGERQFLLDLCDIGVSHRCLVDVDLALLGDQATTGTALATLHSNAETANNENAAFASHVDRAGNHQGFECAWVSEINTCDEEASSYDIVTDKHCYVANGIVVHNSDHVINNDLVESGFTLPKPNCCDPKYKNMTTEEVYELLPKIYISIAGGGTGDDDGKSDPGGCGGVLDAPGNANAQEEAKQTWETAVRTAISVAKGNNPGHIPGSLQRLINDLQRPKVSWRELTRNFIDQSMTKDISWSRISRRSVSIGTLMPGLISDRLNQLIMIVDISGSISHKLAVEMVSEAAGALDQGTCDELVVLYADTEVRNVDRFVPGDIVKCATFDGGGTDFRESFKWVAENAPNASCVIYLTDLQVYEFGEDPGCPTLWAVYGPSQYYDQLSVKVPFGTSIHVSNSYG